MTVHTTMTKNKCTEREKSLQGEMVFKRRKKFIKKRFAKSL